MVGSDEGSDKGSGDPLNGGDTPAGDHTTAGGIQYYPATTSSLSYIVRSGECSFKKALH